MIPLTLDAEERDSRLLHTRPNSWHNAEGFAVARKANDHFAARFYLDRILSLSEQRTTARFQERNALQAGPARHRPHGLPPPRPLAKVRYDCGMLALLGVNGDRMVKRNTVRRSTFVKDE